MTKLNSGFSQYWERAYKFIFNKLHGGAIWICTGSGQGQVAGPCERGNELSGSFIRGEFLPTS